MDDVRFCYGLKFTSFALRTALYSEWHWAHSKSAVPPWTGSRASVPSKPQSGHASFSSVGFRSLKRKARQIGGYTDRKSTRPNSSHGYISSAGFWLEKKKEHATSNTSSLSARSQHS